MSNILSGIPADYNITPKAGSWSISQLAVTVTALQLLRCL